MPAIFAHYAFGAEALPKFAAPVQRIVRSHRALFDLGVQGPDFYFFDQFLMLLGKRYARTGSALHHGSCASLLQALEGEGGRRPDNGALAYLFGLIGHFALDQAAHPSIDRWVAALNYNHHRLETEFDRFLLERAGMAPRYFRLGACMAAPRRQRLQVGRLYEAAGLGKAEDVAALLSDFGRIKNHTTLKSDRAYRVVQGVLKAIGAWNAIGGIFMGPKDALSEITNPRLLTIFEEAQARYVQLVANYYAHVFRGDALDAYFQRDFETNQEEDAYEHC